jgi:NADH-quinone oxidoreductase subunit M
MASWPILSVTTFLPLLGALFIMMMRGEDPSVARNARWVALWTTLITFAISLILVWRFDTGTPEFQFVEKKPWLAGTISYHMGVDGISLPFVILTTALMPICIVASWRPIQRRVKAGTAKTVAWTQIRDEALARIRHGGDHAVR